MANELPSPLSPIEQLQSVRASWGKLLALGICLVIIGMLAITFPIASTFFTIEVIGFLLLFAAGVQFASGIWGRKWGGFFVHLLMGLLYLFIGIVILERPIVGAGGYTLMLAVFFFAGGLFRIIFAIDRRYHGWGWTVFSGAIGMILGIMIWRNFPSDSLWVIGTFVGIDLLFVGWGWIMLALAAKGAQATTTGSEPPASA